MIFLLDTHTLLWATLAPTSLPRKIAELIADPDNRIVVSAASAWEIATKVRSGKLAFATELEKNFIHKVVDVAGYHLRAITVEDALLAGRLAGDHRDPFDRMIAAQALADHVPILSNDAKLDSFGVRRIW